MKGWGRCCDPHPCPHHPDWTLLRNLIAGLAAATTLGLAQPAAAGPTSFFYANLFCEMQSGNSSLCQVFPYNNGDYTYSWNVSANLIVDGGCGTNDDYCAVRCWLNRGGPLSVTVTNIHTQQVSQDSVGVGCGFPRR